MEKTSNIKDLRAWIYEIMAQLEKAEDVEASKSETFGGKITLEIQIKY